MYDIAPIIIGIIIGCCSILYGFSRNEVKSNIFDNVRTEDIIVTNEKAFVIATKIYFVILGFTAIAIGFLLYNHRILDSRGAILCFTAFLIFQLVIQLFIRFKCCKKVK